MDLEKTARIANNFDYYKEMADKSGIFDLIAELIQTNPENFKQQLPVITEQVYNIGEKVYTKAQQIGTYQANTILLTSIGLTVLFTVVSLWLIYYKDPSKYPVKGKVISIRCNRNSTEVQPLKCSVDIQFEYEGEILTRNVITSIEHKIGEIIDAEVVLNESNKYTYVNIAGYVLLGLSGLLLFLGVTNYITIKKMPELAASRGLLKMINTFV